MKTVNNFMNRSIKIILIISIAVLGTGFLFNPTTKATAVPLTVEWSEDGSAWSPLIGPMFNETNFLPGNGVTRLVRVANYSGEIQRIATEAINKNDPANFASQINLNIKEGPTIIFDDALAEFFEQGETYLSSLASGATTIYDFTITFNSGSDNDYQGETLGFDILVGFEGTEGGVVLPPQGGGTGGGDGGGGGGGGFLPPGLTIQNETTATTTETSVTLTWTTSYPASSQIIYAKEDEKHILDLTDNIGIPPKYGYEYTTSEYDISPKVIFHSVTITGLASNTKYYYRAVSHASLAISQEYTFITLAAQGQEPTLIAPIGSTEQPTGEPGGALVATPGFAGPAGLNQSGLGGSSAGTSTQATASVESGSPVVESPNFLLAAISNFITLGTGNNIVMIVVIFVIALIIYLMMNAYFVKKKK